MTFDLRLHEGASMPPLSIRCLWRATVEVKIALDMEIAAVILPSSEYVKMDET